MFFCRKAKMGYCNISHVRDIDPGGAETRASPKAENVRRCGRGASRAAFPRWSAGTIMNDYYDV
jgi:hypothetical protein